MTKDKTSLVKCCAVALVTTTCQALDNGFTTPPMGWSALYGAPFNQVNETNVQTAALGLASGGFRDVGYKYVNLDDWYATRDPTTGQIMGNEHFPSGMRATADVVHSHGLLFGVYSAASQRTCGNYSASLFLEHQDATTLANNWTIDMLKYDACIYNNGVASRTRYLAMSRALNATGRKIFYSVEGWEGQLGIFSLNLFTSCCRAEKHPQISFLLFAHDPAIMLVMFNVQVRRKPKATGVQNTRICGEPEMISGQSGMSAFSTICTRLMR